MVTAFYTRDEDLEDVVQALEQAKQEWLAARNFFSEVTDPDLIDVAIYRLEAAERRYMYLWKLVRQGKLKDSPNEGVASR
ncbi:MAG: hypothetical protein PWP65_115 [Clostridia bacterium]|nr:hypothetical protein [Clostridia bacterium]